jgi:hypothetical protein
MSNDSYLIGNVISADLRINSHGLYYSPCERRTNTLFVYTGKCELLARQNLNLSQVFVSYPSRLRRVNVQDDDRDGPYLFRGLIRSDMGRNGFAHGFGLRGCIGVA